jgi:long-subunit fatty acid transport protein
MTRILKNTMFVARLPLSVFSRVQGTKLNSKKLYSLHTTLSFICIAIAASLFLHLPQAQCAFLESIAVDPEAIGVANSVTANPPGISSIYYNPAGLSLMKEGTYMSLGLVPVVIKSTVKLSTDPNFQKYHNAQGQEVNDPLDGTESTNESGRMFIPLLNRGMDMPALTVPVLGFSHRAPDSKWTFGYSVYVPYGGGWSNESDSNSRFDNKEVYLQHLVYAGPGVSYRVNKNISIGASFGLGQTALGMNLDNRAPSALTNMTKILGDATQGMANPIFDLTVPLPLFGGGLGPYDMAGNLSFNIRDDFSPSYNFGALWEPLDWFAFGASYNSAVKSHLSGKYTFSYFDNFKNFVAWDGSTAIMQIVSMIFDLPYEPTSQQTGTLTTDIEWPQMANFGIKLKPIKRLSLMTDLHWADWSSTKETNLVFDQKIQLLQILKFMGYTGGSQNMILRRNMKDTWNWSVGAEVQALDWLTLRAGYERRQASTQYQFYDLQYAVPDLDYYGVGMGIQGSGTGIKMLEDLDIDLALGYLFNNAYKIRSGGSQNLTQDQLGNYMYNPYAGLDVEQKLRIFMGALKVTMPLEVITGLLAKGIDIFRPSKWSGSPTGAKVVTLKPVDSSANIIDNMRYENKYYFIEDSE